MAKNHSVAAPTDRAREAAGKVAANMARFARFIDVDGALNPTSCACLPPACTIACASACASACACMTKRRACVRGAGARSVAKVVTRGSLLGSSLGPLLVYLLMRSRSDGTGPTLLGPLVVYLLMRSRSDGMSRMSSSSSSGLYLDKRGNPCERESRSIRVRSAPRTCAPWCARVVPGRLQHLWCLTAQRNQDKYPPGKHCRPFSRGAYAALAVVNTLQGSVGACGACGARAS